MKTLIRRKAPGVWVVLRPPYGFGDGTWTAATYPTWVAAMRSVLFVSLGGAGSAERDTKRGLGVSL